MSLQVWHRGVLVDDGLSGHSIQVARKWLFNSRIAGLRHLARNGLRLRTIHRQYTDPTVNGDVHQRPPPAGRGLDFSPRDMTLSCWVDSALVGRDGGRMNATAAPRRTVPAGATLTLTGHPGPSAAKAREPGPGRDLDSPFRDHTATCLSVLADGELIYHHHGESLITGFLLRSSARGVYLTVFNVYELGVIGFRRSVTVPGREITIQL